MKAWVIASNQLKRFARDKVAIFFSVIFPVILIFFIGTATSGFDNDGFEVGIVTPGDAGPLATDLRDAFEEHPRIVLTAFDDRLDLAKAVRRGTMLAGIVIRDGYDASLRAGKPADVELVIDQTRGSPAGIRSLIAEVIADRGGVLQAAIFANRHEGVPIASAIAKAERTSGIVEGVEVTVETSTVGEADEDVYIRPGLGYQAPSNLILFVFITSVAAAALMIQSRQLRVTQRIYATPTSARQIIFGEGLARLSIAGGQALFIFLVGRLFFGVEWGQSIGAAALIVMFVLVGSAFGLLFGTLFSTPDQAGAIGPMSGMAMGMLGGCMWPLEIVPAPMRTLGHLFPHAWAMDAWIDLIGAGGTIADIVPELAVLAGFVVVLTPVAIWRLRRTLVA